jgi:hypothetical protein
MSTPAKTRTLAAAAVALACCLAAIIAVASGALGGQFQSIGNRDAPAVNSTTGLYFSLNDMDAQVANVLLVGGDTTLAADRAQDLEIYGSDRATADADLTQALATSGGNAAAQRELRSALDGVGQYEALAADALLTDQQATDLMRTSILPSVSSLTNVSAAKLDASYSDGTSTAWTTVGLVIAAGVALIAILVGLQLYLSARYRRLVNPALVAATLVGVALVITATTRLSAEAGHLKVAKQDAFDSILALTQARAVSYNGNADESRYLVDPARAAQYQQSFLAKSQQLADVGNVGIFGYDAALATDIRAYDGDNSDVRFGGYLGTEFRNITFPGERAAAVRTLLAYQVYERDDRKLRALAKTNLPAAVAFDIGTAPGQSDGAFNTYGADLSSVIAINSAAFADAIQAGQGDTATWNVAFPAAGAVLLAGLVLAGVRPRLAEYH